MSTSDYQPGRQFGAVIFDFNGVLWWDGALQEEAWLVYSAQLRGRALSDEEMAVHVHGRVNGYTLGYLLGREPDAAEIERLSEEKESLYRAMCIELGPGFSLSPGAVELLHHLKAAAVPRTIATASAWPNVRFFIDHFGLERWFDVKKIVYDDGLHRGKPAPDPYRLAAAALGYDPADCIVVEDSRSGIASAAAAGVGHIIALGPTAEHGRLAALPGVSSVIDSLAAFPREIVRPRRQG